ncbi:MAG: hypothetical protein KME16_14220 [Scytolyngbya sp. HA4215-MV1]|nr:hypothetical protein [Scytolyngbya sp. HA4215-MV1]
MTKVIKNLALPLITEEIENVLDVYHHCPYQQVYADPELRQCLISYVLNSIPSFYVMIEEENRSQNSWNLLPSNFRQ